MEVNLAEEFLAAGENEVDVVEYFFVVGYFIIDYSCIVDDAFGRDSAVVYCCMD